MTSGKTAAPARWLLLGVLVSIAGLIGCSNQGAAPGPEPKPLTAAQAQEVLAQHGPSGDGRFPGGTFTFGSPFDNSTSPFDSSGTETPAWLASASWDVYWHSDDGDRGVWGVGITVLRTSGHAARALDEGAAFWCPRTRRGVQSFADGGLADVRVSTCERAGGDGFYGTLDAADGPVLTSLTVGGPTRPAAVAALRAVWPEIRDAVVRVRASLGSASGSGWGAYRPVATRYAATGSVRSSEVARRPGAEVVPMNR